DNLFINSSVNSSIPIIMIQQLNLQYLFIHLLHPYLVPFFQTVLFNVFSSSPHLLVYSVISSSSLTVSLSSRHPVFQSPRLPVSLSPSHLVSLSPHLPVSLSPSHNHTATSALIEG
ncbi:MAG TPA: hypothetical protein PLT90_03700, partial [Bacteroidales bacterium]|nr:hypothetical protein [Bacteroidales bacterium]